MGEVNLIIQDGGGRKLARVSWNDTDGDKKIDKDEASSVKIYAEKGDEGNLTSEETASTLSARLFQIIDKNLQPGTAPDDDSPNAITDEELGLFISTADRFAADNGVSLETVIEAYNDEKAALVEEDAAGGESSLPSPEYRTNLLRRLSAAIDNGNVFEINVLLADHYFMRKDDEALKMIALFFVGRDNGKALRFARRMSVEDKRVEVLNRIYESCINQKDLKQFEIALRLVGEYRTPSEQADRAKQLVDKIIGLADARYDGVVLRALANIPADYIPGVESRPVWVGETTGSFIDRIKQEISISPTVRLAMVKVFEYKRTEKGWAWAPKENLSALESAQSNLSQIIRDESGKPSPDKTLVTDAWYALAQCLMVQGFSQWDNDVDINPDRPKEAALQTFQKAAAVFRVAMDQYADLANSQSLEAKSRYFEKQKQNSAGSIAGLAYLPLHMRRGSHLGEKEVGGESKKRKDFLKAWACLLITYLPETTNTVVVYRGGIRDWREHPEGYPVPQAGNAMAFYINLTGGAKAYDRKYLNGKGLSNYGIKSGSNSYRVQAEQMAGITPIKTD